MTWISRHAALGAFVAAVLMLGANAGSDNGLRSAAPPHGVLNAGTQAVLADLSEAYQTCRNVALDVALDVFGEIAGRLKQH